MVSAFLTSFPISPLLPFQSSQSNVSWPCADMPAAGAHGKHTHHVTDKNAISANPAATPADPTILTQAELAEPTLDIHAQYAHYNKKHFHDSLKNVTLEFSTRMTLCAGTCTFRPPQVRIALSEPLLKLRPRADLLSTLLHEMIHAYLFLNGGPARDGPDGHGPMFLAIARRIMQAEPGVSITPYHSFQAEVDHYRVHHWQCGHCDMLIKRAMNRAPAPTDAFWPSHSSDCGGDFRKVAEPPKKERIPKPPKNGAVAVAHSEKSTVAKGVMKTFRIDHMLANRINTSKPVPTTKCPVCDASIQRDAMNDHLDECLAAGIFTQQQPSPLPQQSTSDAPPQGQTRSPGKTEQRGSLVTNPPRLKLPRKRPRSIPSPEQSPRNPRLSRNQNSVAITKAPSPDSHGVMDFIADPDALMDLAFNPKAFSAERVDKIFRPMPPHISHSSSRNMDVNTALRSLLQPETPHEKEKQAKAAIERLKPICERPSVPRDSNSRLPATSSQLPNEQNNVWDSAFVDSNQHLKAVPSAERNASSYSSPKNAVTRPRRDPLAVREKRDAKSHTTEGYHEMSKTVPPKAIAGSSIGVCVGKAQEFGSRRCPICENAVPDADFDQHLSGCLIESEIPDDELSADETNSVNVETEGMKLKSCSSHVPGEQVHASDQEDLTCPICDVRLLRKDMEGHVATCMTNAGLADAF